MLVPVLVRPGSTVGTVRRTFTEGLLSFASDSFFRTIRFDSRSRRCDFIGVSGFAYSFVKVRSETFTPKRSGARLPPQSHHTPRFQRARFERRTPV